MNKLTKLIREHKKLFNFRAYKMSHKKPSGRNSYEQNYKGCSVQRLPINQGRRTSKMIGEV